MGEKLENSGSSDFGERSRISGIPVDPIGLKDAIEDFVVDALLSAHHSVEGSRSEPLNRELLNNTLGPEN
jgi:hypothetical protein